MNDELMTVATFTNPAEACIARSCLEDAGITAFLADEGAAVALSWSLTNAMGGVKLQVPTREYDQAIAVLTDSRHSDMHALDQAALDSDFAESEKLEPPSTSSEGPTMRLTREHWLLIGNPLTVQAVLSAVTIVLAAVIALMSRGGRGPVEPPPSHYVVVSQTLEDELSKLARMREWRAVRRGTQAQAEDIEEDRKEQKQLDLVRRLVKERDAAKEAMK